MGLSNQKTHERKRDPYLDEVAERILKKIGVNEHGYHRILIPDRIKREDEEIAEATVRILDATKEAEKSRSNFIDEVRDELRTHREEENAEIEDAVEALIADDRNLPVFSLKMIELVEAAQKRMGGESRRRVEGGVALMRKNNGLRRIPDFSAAINKLEDLREQFENFSDVIDHLQRELILANAMRPASFRISPILLDGDPGVGKTAFTNALSRTLDVPFMKLSAGGLQHAAVFTGTASHWSNAQTGEVFNLIAGSDSATGIFLIDEADKISNRGEYQVLPALLDLLEPESSRAYRDESLGISFDASRLIVLLTSNVIANMDKALLSRCKVFVIKKPSDEQKMKIAVSAFNEINDELKEKLDPNLPAIEEAVQADMDIRELLMMIRNACAAAIHTRSKKLELVRTKKEERSRQIGFVRDEIRP